MKKIEPGAAHIFTVIILLLCTSAVKAQNVTLIVSGIKSNKGQIYVTAFKDQASFKSEKPLTVVKFSKETLANGVLKVNFTLEQGTYGVVLIDDENNNGKMDKNFFGIPKEGFGFSNFYLSGFSRPTFNDFKFEVGKTPVKIETKLRFM